MLNSARRNGCVRGKELYQELLRRMSGGSDYRACLHHLLPLCGNAPCGQSRCSGGVDGVELYRGTCFQYELFPTLWLGEPAKVESGTGAMAV